MISKEGFSEAAMLTLEMEKAPFEFFLTGSHFFGTDTSGSDYDFFTLNTEEAQKWLREHKFIVMPSTYYEDPNVDEVWINADANVHVQLVRDVEAKRVLQKVMKDANLQHVFVNKKILKKIWNFGFLLIQVARHMA